MTCAESVETERLLLRPFEPDDVDSLFAIQGDRDAMRYTLWAETREDSRHYLGTYAALRREHGFAPWTVVFRPDERIVGWGGLSIDPFAPGWGPEVGYFVHREYWGRGIASEIVDASLRHGFVDLGLPVIGAFAQPANAASLRVLEKAGFRLVRFEPELGRNHYELRAADWAG